MPQWPATEPQRPWHTTFADHGALADWRASGAHTFIRPKAHSQALRMRAPSQTVRSPAGATI
jgi:hypothetical protein